MRPLREIEAHNRDHPLTLFNRYVSWSVWAVGFAAISAAFLPADTPVIRSLPLATGTHARIDHLLVQVSLLLLFLNTHTVFRQYISHLDHGLLCRLTGSAVYTMHLVSVLWTLLRPYDWLLCVAGILLVRLSLIWQLSFEINLRTPDHPWRGLLRNWLGRSVLDAVLVLMFALLVETVSDFSLFTYLHGLRIEASGTELAQILVGDVRTLMYIVACYEIGTRALPPKRVMSTFSAEEIREQQRLLDEYHQ